MSARKAKKKKLLIHEDFYLWVFIGLVGFWILLVVMTPVMMYFKFGLMSKILNFLFGTSCHQLSSRSLFIMGYQMPVCTRCFAIYFAFFIGCLVFQIGGFKRNKIISRWWFLVFILPMAIDGTTQLFRLRESNNYLRFLTGFLAGVIVPFYVIPGYYAVIKMFRKEIER